jgi:hypothetical protein
LRDVVMIRHAYSIRINQGSSRTTSTSVVCALQP